MSKTAATIFFLASVLVSTTNAQQQQEQHAPTVQQCRADRDLWASELKDKHTISSHNLGFRQHEMLICMMIIDPPPEIPRAPEGSGSLEEAQRVLSDYIVAQEKYELAVSKWQEYMAVRLACAEELENRLIAFMARHDLVLDDTKH